jgi:hypothetical protein
MCIFSVIVATSLGFIVWRLYQMGCLGEGEEMDLDAGLLFRKDFFDNAASGVASSIGRLGGAGSTAVGATAAKDMERTRDLGEMSTSRLEGPSEALYGAASAALDAASSLPGSALAVAKKWDRALEDTILNLGSDADDVLREFYDSAGMPGRYPGAESAKQIMAEMFAACDVQLPPPSEIHSIDSLSEMAEVWSDAFEGLKDAMPRLNFIPAASFDGARQGYSFESRDGRTGYFKVDEAKGNGSSAIEQHQSGSPVHDSVHGSSVHDSVLNSVETAITRHATGAVEDDDTSSGYSSDSYMSMESMS